MDASVAPSSVAPSSSAPRVSFVEVRPKWLANQPPPPARAPAALSDAAGAHRRDVPLTRDVEAWMERVRLRPAPPGHFVEVSALHALFVADLDAAARARSPPASSSAPASPPEVSLQTFSSVLGKTMRRAERARGSDPRAAAPSARRLRPRQAPKRPSQRDVRPPPREGPRPRGSLLRVPRRRRTRVVDGRTSRRR